MRTPFSTSLAPLSSLPRGLLCTSQWVSLRPVHTSPAPHPHLRRFISGVLGAKFSPTVLLAGGLMSTALINIAFGFGTSLGWFVFFWGLNGTLQV